MPNLDSPWHLAEGVQATVPHRLPSGHVVQLWRAGPEPHPHGWYEPAALLCHVIRSWAPAEALELDDLRFVGRVDDPVAGSLFAYAHHGSGGELLVDATGIPHRPVDEPRRRTGVRFEAAGLAEALALLRVEHRAAAPTPVPERAAPAPADDHDRPDAVVLPFRPRGVVPAEEF